MRVLVCEYVTGGGFGGEPLPPGLRREGDLMVHALVKDLASVPGVAVTVARDRRLPAPDLPVQPTWFDLAEGDPWRFWETCIEAADAVWPIAPETDGALERLSRLVLERGRTLLGCTPEAVRLTASKLATARHLETCGVPVVPSWPGDGPVAARFDGGWVLKPDDGAGCEETAMLERPDAASRVVPAGRLGRYVLQPYVAGTPASLSLICRDGEAVLLSCNRQLVTRRAGVLRYAGSIVGGMEHRRVDFQPLAAAVARAIPGLWGHVGIDVVDGTEGPVVVEINPRLTSSYAGLAEASGANPAARVLALLDGAPSSLSRQVASIRPVTVEVGPDHG